MKTECIISFLHEDTKYNLCNLELIDLNIHNNFFEKDCYNKDTIFLFNKAKSFTIISLKGEILDPAILPIITTISSNGMMQGARLYLENGLEFKGSFSIIKLNIEKNFDEHSLLFSIVLKF
ncbi:hypothetical protein Cyrtocomes_00892 [Candidatus Cyrtobacter comes]|uniref:Uncharacterized protein n=1 Tax=Candidatus Cyrtobacter comes TaxID=675776 RepID=A0ABU5L9F5_9RICK|nr:hypothetical protein [Candidatus Cyrtobacter comes]